MRAEDCSFDKAMIDATYEIAFQANIYLPEDFHEASDDEFAFEFAWFNPRTQDWKKQQGTCALSARNENVIVDAYASTIKKYTKCALRE